VSMPTRPESDRALDDATALRALREQLPALDCNEARLIGSGWGCDVYLVDGRWVARFPRNAENAKDVDQDAAVLELVSSELGEAFRVPRLLHRGRAGAHFPYDFLVCDYLPGLCADDPPAPRSDALATELGRALTQIHAVPLERARRAGLTQPEWDEYRGPLHFLHRDFCRSNLIVDPSSGRLAGVIDWGNASLGDPASDFVGLVCWRGWSFTNAVLDAYESHDRGDLVDRIRRAAQIASLEWLLDAVKRGAPTEPHLSSVRNAFSLDGGGE
jgi:aminoglycoside phosphotransferase (APT) family kinase protein